ncbi:MAG TPA: hypothetical protein ENH19_03545, partial [Actinobacteria bacterium]|nr:hypothetical protein [Actinomycetes bacterium]HEX21708.1 hypothetical protein [Actinomycetota bacterium]
MRHKIIIIILIIVSTLVFSGCQSSDTPQAVRGEDGSSFNISWSVNHASPSYAKSDPRRTKIDIAVDAKQNVYLLDKLEKREGRRRGQWLTKVKPDGNIVWTKRQLPERPYKILPQAIAVDSHNN